MKLSTLSLTIMFLTLTPAEGIILSGKINVAESKSFDAKTAIIVADRSHPTMDYAVKELVYFLEKTSGIEILQDETKVEGNHWKFQLVVDSKLPKNEFEVACSQPVNKQVVVQLVGHDPTGVLHAVYTMLEKLGICFDITGPTLPASIDLRNLIGWSADIIPQVELRGIRQHINFPMDISSYPLAEAKEYIRNLARLRMNLIVLHSYTGQFFECSELNIKAGSFFYGQRHDLPETPLFKNNIRNRRTFCIPEIEAIFDRPTERSNAAVYWLAEVIHQAKTCGLTVQFSFGPSERPEAGLKACQAILTSYPQIDVLEMITNENGGNPEKAIAQNLITARQLKEKLGSKCPQLTLGVYETGPALKDGLNYLRQNCPADIKWSFLPAHGGRAVVKAVRDANFTKEDWQRTVMYSWVEFDGNMFILQNSVLATQQLINLAKSSLGNAPVPAIAFNHWRTAENRTSIRYAARACLEAGFTPEMFYKEYAHALGIKDAELYTKAMKELDDVDAFNRDNLFNIGFCFVGCWTGPAGLSWTRPWKKENTQSTADHFSEIRKMIAGCLYTTSTNEGRKYLRFLDNRLHCSIIHLQAIDHLLDLHSLCDDKHPEALSDKDKKVVQEHCIAAMKLAEQYMNLHAEAIEDRGCEGTLISYYHTVPAYIKHIEDLYVTGTSKTKKPESISQPPAPGESSNNK